MWIFLYVYMIFCLWFFCLLFFVCFPRFVLISIRKTTNTYIQVFLRFLLFFFCSIVCVVFQYIFFSFSFSFAVRVQSTPAVALQILGYGFCFRFLKFIRLVLLIGSTKIVSHFLRNFVERDVFIGTLLHRWAIAFQRLLCVTFCSEPCTPIQTRMHDDSIAWSQKCEATKQAMADGGEEKNCRCQSLREQIVIVIIFLFFVFFCLH